MYKLYFFLCCSIRQSAICHIGKRFVFELTKIAITKAFRLPSTSIKFYLLSAFLFKKKQYTTKCWNIKTKRSSVFSGPFIQIHFRLNSRYDRTNPDNSSSSSERSSVQLDSTSAIVSNLAALAGSWSPTDWGNSSSRGHSLYCCARLIKKGILSQVSTFKPSSQLRYSRTSINLLVWMKKHQIVVGTSTNQVIL